MAGDGVGVKGKGDVRRGLEKGYPVKGRMKMPLLSEFYLRTTPEVYYVDSIIFLSSLGSAG